MQNSIAFVMLFLILSLEAKAQRLHEIKGKLIDSTGASSTGVDVQLTTAIDTIATVSNTNGVYHFSKVKPGTYLLRVYQNGITLATAPECITQGSPKAIIIPPIAIAVSSHQLAEVIVSVDPILIKEDTIQYNTRAIKLRDGAMAEDLIKRLPDVTIDSKQRINAQGKPVLKIRVNGKDYFENDVQIALQNLPAGIIDNIQVIDDYGDLANVTGMKVGEPAKITNINIRKDRSHGNIGNATVGVGTRGCYLGSVMASNFRNERQLSMQASTTNATIGANTFDGIRAETVNQGNGITSNTIAGLNYRNTFGKKVTISGSYNLSVMDNTTESSVITQDLNPNSNRFTRQHGVNIIKNYSHRVTTTAEYQIDVRNYIKVSPSFSIVGTKTAGSTASTINQTRFYTGSNSITENQNISPSTGATVLYNHKFNKKGRIFNINAGLICSDAASDRTNNNIYLNVDSISTDTPGTTPIFANRRQSQNIKDKNSKELINVALSYLEPLSKCTVAELCVGYNRSLMTANHLVYDIDSATSSQSLNEAQLSVYESDFIATSYGLNLKCVTRKYNYILGLSVQTTNLYGNDESRKVSTNYRALNWAPTGRFVYHFRDVRTVTINYDGNTRPPSIQQLQPVVDSSNLTNIVMGNPNLTSEFANRLSIGYNASNKHSFVTLFANLSGTQTLHKIVLGIRNDLQSTSRTTTYLNTEGTYSLDGNISVSKPFASRKYLCMLNVLGRFDNSISYIDTYRHNGQNWSIAPAATMQISLRDLIDIDADFSYLVNGTETKYNDHVQRTQVQTFSFHCKSKIYFLKDFTLCVDYLKLINSGFVGGAAPNPTVLSVYIDYRFLKGREKATVRVQGFDLLNENTGVFRTVVGSSISDSQYYSLYRYFLVSVNLKISEFVK
jgi:hypothetical protein